MRKKSLSIIIFFVMLCCAIATSYVFTLEEKVAKCTTILRVSVSGVAAPDPQSSRHTAACTAQVLDVLKGPGELKTVEFRFNSYGRLTPEKLREMIGQEYLVFLHEPPLSSRPPNERWVFEGPRGIRPIAEEYTEYRVLEGKMKTERFDHTNYLNRIRSLVRSEENKEEQR